MIPSEKLSGVTRALREAFGVETFEEISTVSGGQSASLVFRIIVRGSAYILKIITRPYDVDTLNRLFNGMKAGADAGLAPRVRYTSIEDRMLITDFVNAVPFPMADALVRVPATLRTLHALPPFAKVPDYFNNSCMFMMNKGPGLDAFIQRFRAANILTQSECDELFGVYAQLSAAYPYHNPEMVSSHNDLFKPDNILFDGQRVWLIDWEAAFLNDRYADLAVVGNLLVENDAEEEVYLRTYFGQEPDGYQRARIFYMQQVSHMFYALVFLLIGSSGTPIDRSESLPEWREFHRRWWVGEVNLSDTRAKVVYGRLHWERLLHNARRARFKDALEIVGVQKTAARAQLGPP